VAVVVQPRREVAAPTLEAIQEHCRAHIAGFKVPRQMLVVEAIPLTAAGKPDAKAAKALF
jgi:acyl-CoA synthetase (AMP-forming)/AMP-acid ligase II